jgi:hypothetical protein
MRETSSKDSQALSLDEFLKVQKTAEFTATVEEVKDQPHLAKITPWVPGAGCLCHAALEVSRDAIESVRPTGDTHYCCGHVLRVGQVQFKSGAKIDLEKVFAQMIQMSGGRGAHNQLPFLEPPVVPR